MKRSEADRGHDHLNGACAKGSPGDEGRKMGNWKHGTFWFSHLPSEAVVG